MIRGYSDKNLRDFSVMRTNNTLHPLDSCHSYPCIFNLSTKGGRTFANQVKNPIEVEYISTKIDRIGPSLPIK